MDIGDRMKKYESVSRQYLITKTPVIIRIDGRNFHNLSKKHKFKKPFDKQFIHSMIKTSEMMAQHIQGCICYYTQSDEASFLLVDYQKDNQQAWFGYNINKLISISASFFTLKFNDIMGIKDAMFDSRAFNVPRDDLPNYFLWRIKDWKRNSTHMLARTMFSHNQLNKKSSFEIKEMTEKHGRSWYKMPKVIKYGTFGFNKQIDRKWMVTHDKIDDYNSIDYLISECEYSYEEE